MSFAAVDQVTSRTGDAKFEGPVPKELLVAPPGHHWSPSLLKAVLTAIDYHVTAGDTIPPSGEGKRVYAILVGKSGVRVGSVAEANFNSKGFPRNAARGFVTVAEALAYCDIFTMHENPDRIQSLAKELQVLRTEVANTAARMGAFSQGPLMKSRDLALEPLGHSWKITRLPYEVDYATPRSLNTIVAGHRVELTFEMPIDSTPLVVHTETRANLAVQLGDVKLIDYSPAMNVPLVQAEFDLNGAPTRVIPFQQLVVEDLILPTTKCALMPVHPVRRRPRPRGIYYWVVLQGTRVGIFECSVEEIAKLLPVTYSVARACLTLDEASEFWYQEIERGFPLAEVLRATSVEEQVRAALAKVSGEHPAVDVLAEAFAEKATIDA